MLELSDNDTIYNYDKITNEFIGESKGHIDPLETEKAGHDIYNHPSYSTFQKVPEYGKNQIPVFENNTWVIKKDYRGSAYYSVNGEKITITEIDVVTPLNVIRTSPPENMFKPQYIKGKWTETAIVYYGKVVTTKIEVDSITSSKIRELGEDKAKTEKMISGSNSCPLWDSFLVNREKLLAEGRKFITNNKLT